MKVGDYEQGRQHLATAYGLSPYASVVLNNYAMVLTMVDPPELNKAKELIDDAVKRDPANAENLDSQGRILLMLKDVSNAIASFEKALSIHQIESTPVKLLSMPTKRMACQKWPKLNGKS